ncbi:aldose epimerase family protein [Helcococcus ovis]|uniref:aldose epimerase family protein n=1 Tax=Helcococcus ovis TaxID=72026 RepID=UPI0038BBB782
MILEIKNNFNIAEIDTFGSYLNLLKFDEIDIIFPKQEILEGNDKKIRGGSHVCLPHFGASDKVGMDRHGFGRNSEWEVVELRENYLKLQLVKNIKQWENLISTMEYILLDNFLEIRLVVKNIGKESLFVSPAFHPYFKYESENEIYINGEKFDFNLEKLQNTIFYGKVNTLKTSNYEIVFEDKKLSKYVLWTNGTDKYLCVEPTFNFQALADDKELCEIKPESETEFLFKIIKR